MKKNRKIRYAVCFAVLLSAAAVLFALNISCGSSSIPFSETAAVLAGKSTDTAAAAIVRGIRLPRAAAAVLLGGALSVSGFLLQTYFGNPIAGPYVLGISSGAKLMTALAMIFSLKNGIFLSSAWITAAAFAGAIMSMSLILALSGKVRGMSQLIVAGVMTGYVCSAVTELAVTFADDANIVNLHNWSMGSFSGISTEDVKTFAAVVFAALAAAFMLSKPMSAFRLGESYAASMGVNVRVFRVTLILLSSLLSACVTAFAGPVSFVGAAVPHLMKGLFRTSEPKIMIPAAFLGGGVFCMICDLTARMLFAPTELSISTVTAFFGAPVVIAVMMRSDGKRKDL